MHEVQASVSRLADLVIGDPPETNDFLQRIETDDISFSLGTKLDTLQKDVTEVKALLGQNSLPKEQHFPPKISSVAPSSVWNNSCFKLATAAAPSPTTTNSFFCHLPSMVLLPVESLLLLEREFIITPSVSTMQRRTRILIPKFSF